MEPTSRLITVAIHTLKKAQEFKTLLENEGVHVTLQNVNLTTPTMSAGVRIRIAEADLPLALRIIENPDIFAADSQRQELKPDGKDENHSIVVPIDFSEQSYRLISLAFGIAAESSAKVVILHAFMVPHSNPLTSLGGSLTFDVTDSTAADVESSMEIARIAHNRMSAIERKIRSEIKEGILPAVKHSSVLLEGVPEECISRYVKEHGNVRLLIMGTRSVHKKSLDLSGSITAEVLDTCRIQALTLPDNNESLTSLHAIRRIALLSNLEQEDFLALDAVNRLMPQDQPLEVIVVCMPNDRYSRATNDEARTALRDYCNTRFPQYSFTVVEHKKDSPDNDFTSVDLLVVPNRKKNIFARIFNPGPAHRILFHSDVPMMVIPV